MIRHILGPFCLIVFCCYLSLAQVADHPSLFISGNIGGFVSGVRDFDKIYNSRLAFAFGGSVGVPVSNQLYFCAKLTYFSKSNVTVISTHYYQDGQPVTSSQPITSTISIDQWIMNYGILGKVLPSKDIAIEIDGGLTYSKFSAGPASLVPGETIPDSPVPSHEMVGLFAGIVLEHRYAQSPLSTFVEAQYNQLWAVTSPHVANYGGLNVSGGVRLYLKAH